MRISQARALFSLRRRNPRRTKALAALAVLAAGIPVMMNQSGGVSAVPNLPVIPASTQFDVTGFLQSATLDPACVAAAGANPDASGVHPQLAHCGGTMVINGQTIIVPNETVVILPASALTWQELFAQAPAPYTNVATGMALTDVPKPLTTYEFQAVGNRVMDPNGVNGCAVPAGCDRYIAGLVHVSQQDLNGGAGYINFIDYSTGEFDIGGPLGVQDRLARADQRSGRAWHGCPWHWPVHPWGTFAGRSLPGRSGQPDDHLRHRLSDVHSTCPAVPSSAEWRMTRCARRPTGRSPSAARIPSLARSTRRPASSTRSSRRLIPTSARRSPIPKIQAPMEIGDYVNTAGSVEPGRQRAPTSPPTPSSTTRRSSPQPGIDPAYVMIEVALIGTGGLTVFGAGEAVVRTRFEGMTTDPSRNVRLYGIDINPATGATADRDWGSIGVDPGPPNGAVKGRWRFRPPCTVTVADRQEVRRASRWQLLAAHS